MRRERESTLEILDGGVCVFQRERVTVRERRERSEGERGERETRERGGDREMREREEREK